MRPYVEVWKFSARDGDEKEALSVAIFHETFKCVSSEIIEFLSNVRGRCIVRALPLVRLVILPDFGIIVVLYMLRWEMNTVRCAIVRERPLRGKVERLLWWLIRGVLTSMLMEREA